VSFEERLREAAYTPPSGGRLLFLYEQTGRETPKRTAAFSHPLVDGSYVQDNGLGSPVYSLRCIFNGGDHDLDADAFEAALLERGPGLLEHPVYGRKVVVPFGQITRREDLRRAANETVIETSFWETIEEIYPQTEEDPRSATQAALSDYDEAIAEQFDDQAELDDAAARASVGVTATAQARGAVGALNDAAKATAAASRALRDAEQALNQGLDVLLGEPLALAQQVVQLVRAPAIAASALAARLEGYGDFASSIFASLPGRPADALAQGDFPRRRRAIRNDLLMSDVYASAAVSGSVQSVLEQRFRARPEALAAAAEVLRQFDAWVHWHETSFAALGIVDTGEVYRALRSAAAYVAGYLVEISFTLVPERRIVLDRPRTILDLSAEIFGEVDARLDELIATNELTGDEILELPRGKTIVYYP
jgi:hypothetical protein